MDRRTLERALQRCTGFDSPSVDTEQYATDATVAAHLIHRATIDGNLTGATVVDLGTGTGVLAIGAALAGAKRVIGVDLDTDALTIAEQNQQRVSPPAPIDWLRADVTRLPLCTRNVVVIANPPFGAQLSNRGADRPFLSAAANMARVSYTIHNAGSREFVEAFARERGGEVQDAYRVSLDIPHQFEFHDESSTAVEGEAYRIDWTG